MHIKNHTFIWASRSLRVLAALCLWYSRYLLGRLEILLLDPFLLSYSFLLGLSVKMSDACTNICSFVYGIDLLFFYPRINTQCILRFGLPLEAGWNNFILSDIWYILTCHRATKSRQGSVLWVSAFSEQASQSLPLFRSGLVWLIALSCSTRVTVWPKLSYLSEMMHSSCCQLFWHCWSPNKKPS